MSVIHELRKLTLFKPEEIPWPRAKGLMYSVPIRKDIDINGSAVTHMSIDCANTRGVHTVEEFKIRQIREDFVGAVGHYCIADRAVNQYIDMLLQRVHDLETRNDYLKYKLREVGIDD